MLLDVFTDYYRIKDENEKEEIIDEKGETEEGGWVSEEDEEDANSDHESDSENDEKLDSSLESMTKNINMYFTDTNKQISDLETNINSHKFGMEATIEEIQKEINNRITELQLKKTLKGLDQEIKDKQAIL